MSKISAKQRVSRKKTTRAIKLGMGIDTHDPTDALLDKERIDRAIWECRKNKDSKGAVEIFQIHLEAWRKITTPSYPH